MRWDGTQKNHKKLYILNILLNFQIELKYIYIYFKIIRNLSIFINSEDVKIKKKNAIQFLMKLTFRQFTTNFRSN